MKSHSQVTSGRTLTEGEQQSLRMIASYMIPASQIFAVPGADDAVIFADILASLGRDSEMVWLAMEIIHSLSGSTFVDLSRERQLSILGEFRINHRPLAAALETVVAQCYYRDDRVMQSIGMEVRAPFPRGFEVEPRDFTLLAPVRARGKKYRDVT